MKQTETIELIIQELTKSGIKNRSGLDSFKRRAAKKHQLACPTNIALLKTYHEMLKKKRLAPSPIIETVLRRRPVRSLSGIVNVSVLTKPYPCPGKCIFCPTQKGIPKSYLSKEPAVQRAILNKFHPYLQVQSRLQTLKEIGHPIDKIELRIIGGTWSYYPKNYQKWFIAECFRACNEFSLKNQILNKKAMAFLLSIRRLKGEQKKNEGTRCRIVGISVETRPDYINLEEMKRMRKLGITRVELGVQTIYDDILKLNKRGHGISSTIKATQLLKDAGFKVSYQIMPNLPGSNFQKDIAIFKELFSNKAFKPDLLKIYPLALVKQAPLYRWYKSPHHKSRFWCEDKYKPYAEKKLLELLIEIKKHIPRYCRIERIIRDIPSADIIEGGVQTSNLRETAQKEMKKRGLKCQCIRCREVGSEYNPKEKLYLFREDYKASGAKEIFLTFENKKRERLYALLRLRLPSQFQGDGPPEIMPILRGTAIIREIHTYGQLAELHRVRVGSEISLTPQHKGLGKRLIKEAEEISKNNGYPKIAVISGIGVRPYYRKLGYRLKDTYMIKKFK